MVRRAHHERGYEIRSRDRGVVFEIDGGLYSMVSKKLLGKLRQYRKLLSSAGIPVAKVVLYGSRARGDCHRESDIDICVVSKVFGRRHLAEGVQINTLAHQIDPLIEAVPCSLKDWETDRCSPLLHEIRRDGIGVK